MKLAENDATDHKRRTTLPGIRCGYLVPYSTTIPHPDTLSLGCTSFCDMRVCQLVQMPDSPHLLWMEEKVTVPCQRLQSLPFRYVPESLDGASWLTHTTAPSLCGELCIQPPYWRSRMINSCGVPVDSMWTGHIERPT